MRFALNFIKVVIQKFRKQNNTQDFFIFSHLFPHIILCQGLLFDPVGHPGHVQFSVWPGFQDS